MTCKNEFNNLNCKWIKLRLFGCRYELKIQMWHFSGIIQVLHLYHPMFVSSQTTAVFLVHSKHGELALNWSCDLFPCRIIGGALLLVDADWSRCFYWSWLAESQWLQVHFLYASVLRSVPPSGAVQCRPAPPPAGFRTTAGWPCKSS